MREKIKKIHVTSPRINSSKVQLKKAPFKALEAAFEKYISKNNFQKIISDLIFLISRKKATLKKAPFKALEAAFVDKIYSTEIQFKKMIFFSRTLLKIILGKLFEIFFKKSRFNVMEVLFYD